MKRFNKTEFNVNSDKDYEDGFRLLNHLADQLSKWRGQQTNRLRRAEEKIIMLERGPLPSAGPTLQKEEVKVDKIADIFAKDKTDLIEELNETVKVKQEFNMASQSQKDLPDMNRTNTNVEASKAETNVAEAVLEPISEPLEEKMDDNPVKDLTPVSDTYTAKENKKGNIQYRKNGKLISKEEYNAREQ